MFNVTTMSRYQQLHHNNIFNVTTSATLPHPQRNNIFWWCNAMKVNITSPTSPCLCLSERDSRFLHAPGNLKPLPYIYIYRYIYILYHTIKYAENVCVCVHCHPHWSRDGPSLRLGWIQLDCCWSLGSQANSLLLSPSILILRSCKKWATVPNITLNSCNFIFYV